MGREGLCSSSSSRKRTFSAKWIWDALSPQSKRNACLSLSLSDLPHLICFLRRSRNIVICPDFSRSVLFLFSPTKCQWTYGRITSKWYNVPSARSILNIKIKLPFSSFYYVITSNFMKLKCVPNFWLHQFEISCGRDKFLADGTRRTFPKWSFLSWLSIWSIIQKTSHITSPSSSNFGRN